MDKFLRDEIIGRNKFLSLLELCHISLYYFTELKYDRVDCYYTSHKSHKVAVEIKVRSLLWNTLFMEGSKLLYMNNLIKLLKADLGLYVNFIDDKCYIFKLNLIKKKNGCYISKEWVNATTASYSLKTYKWMVNLPVSLATVYEYKDGKWNNSGK